MNKMITHKEVNYEQLPGNEVYVIVEIDSNEGTKYSKVKRSMWSGLVDFIEDLTGDDLSLIPESLRMKYSPETDPYLPYMLVNGKNIRLTSLGFQDKSDGDMTYLVVDLEGNNLLMKCHYEPDCDGVTYSAYFVEILEGTISDYVVMEQIQWNSKELWGLFKYIVNQ